MKSKYKILLNYIVGPLLFVILSYSIYKKVQHQHDALDAWQVIKTSFTGTGSWRLWVVLLLSIVNWGIEARKWQVLVRPIQRVGLFKALKAVLSGLALSLFIPNRVGEYFGRMLYMEEGNRLRSIALSVVGGFSQLIVTLLAGTVGLLYLQNHALNNTEHLQGLSVIWLKGLLFVIGGGSLFLLFIYYKLSLLVTLLEKIPFISKYRFFIESLESFHWKELTRILTLSIGRFIVFILQYLLMLSIFNVTIEPIAAAWTICVLFLVLAIIPTIPMAEVGLRGEASIRLFGLYSGNTIGILCTAGGIWLINLIIPALAGSLFILGVKLFKKNS